MTQEKKEKVFLSGVVLAVLILVLGIIILIFQGVTVANRKKALNELRQAEAQLEILREQAADDILIWQQQETIEEIARRLGYKYPDDVEKV